MKHNIFRSAVIIIALIGGQANAIPTLYPTEVTKLSMIKNSTNSNLIMDSVDANRVYVMPPNTGEAHVSGLHTVNANVMYCQDMKSSRAYGAQINERIYKLYAQSLEEKSVADKLQAVVNAARLELGRFTESKNLNDLRDLDASIDRLDLRLTDLREQIDKCEVSCEATIAEAKSLQAEKVALVKDRRALARLKAADAREYDRRKNAVEQAVANFEDQQNSYNKIINRATQARNEFMNLFAAYGKLEGARASFSYTGNWDQNVATLRADNTGMSFEKIQTSNVTVYPSLANIKNLPLDGAILSFDLPGKHATGSVQLNAFPEALNANIVLSLFGACPLLHPQDYDIQNLDGAKGMKYGLAVTYDFPSSFKLQVTAKYNMYKMYQKIVSNGSKGGFFSSKSWSKVEERNFFEDSFKVNWSEQDAGNTIKDEERLEIESALRKEILSRIATMAVATSIDKQGIMAAAAPGPHGAVVLADALTKTCPTNVYCAGGAILLNVLDAIFGSGSSTSSYTNIQDIELTETWSRDRVSQKPWITVYQPN